jgi:hypothetical protein
MGLPKEGVGGRFSADCLGLPGLARSTRSAIAAVIRGSQDGLSKLADTNTER